MPSATCSVQAVDLLTPEERRENAARKAFNALTAICREKVFLEEALIEYEDLGLTLRDLQKDLEKMGWTKSLRTLSRAAKVLRDQGKLKPVTQGRRSDLERKSEVDMLSTSAELSEPDLRDKDHAAAFITEGVVGMTKSFSEIYGCWLEPPREFVRSELTPERECSALQMGWFASINARLTAIVELLDQIEDEAQQAGADLYKGIEGNLTPFRFKHLVFIFTRLVREGSVLEEMRDEFEAEISDGKPNTSATNL